MYSITSEIDAVIKYLVVLFVKSREKFLFLSHSPKIFYRLAQLEALTDPQVRYNAPSRKPAVPFVSIAVVVEQFAPCMQLKTRHHKQIYNVLL